MNILFILDPLAKLDRAWDTSLYLLEELAGRGHATWACDVGDILYESPEIYFEARRMQPEAEHPYKVSEPRRMAAAEFQLVVIRKEPPFDENYLYLTYLLELIAARIPVVNHPRGIRSANEKLAALAFPDWTPETMVTNSAEQILRFQKKLGQDLVLKPLPLKGGEGVRRLKRDASDAQAVIGQVTQQGQKMIVAQRFIQCRDKQIDKRLLILNGEILTAYEKHAAEGEFRTNLSLGATFHATEVSAKERRLAEAMRPYFLKEGLSFVGLDVMEGFLIEVNVTCPAGLREAKLLYPRLEPASAWADSLEALIRP